MNNDNKQVKIVYRNICELRKKGWQKCAICSKKFFARIGAKTCSQSCRTKKYNLNKLNKKTEVKK